MVALLQVGMVAVMELMWAMVAEMGDLAVGVQDILAAQPEGAREDILEMAEMELIRDPTHSVPPATPDRTAPGVAGAGVVMQYLLVRSFIRWGRVGAA
jgi:hypothetical protein